MEFYEYEDRLILVREAGLRGWAWSEETRLWRPVSQEFAGRTWASGKRLTDDAAATRYGITLTDLPGESA